MKITPSVFLNLVLTTILATSLFFVASGVRIDSNPSVDAAEYDPWLDYDENGIINMLDLYNTALAYGATGDSTKNVNVTNWPVAAQQTVWWGATSGGSKTYTALGFGHMHLTWRVDGLSGLEYVDFRMSTAIKNPEGGGEYYVNYVERFDVTSANASGAMSFPMPAETFLFYLAFGAGTTATVYFAFYLTYA